MLSPEYINWYNAVPPYSATPHGGIPSDAFVHTVSIEVIYQCYSHMAYHFMWIKNTSPRYIITYTWSDTHGNILITMQYLF